VLPGSKELSMSRSRSTSTRHRFIPQIEALEDRRVPTVLALPIHLPTIPQGGHIHVQPPLFHKTQIRAVTFDPGTLLGVTAGELKFFLSLAVANQTINETQKVKILGFPVKFHVTVSNLQVTNVQIPPQVSRTTVTIKAVFGVSSKLGAFSGTLQFTVQPLVQAAFRWNPPLPFVESPQTLVKAVVLPQNIAVTELNIANVPSAISNIGTVQNWLSHQLTVAPIDVTAFVQVYLQHGGTLPSGSTSTFPHGLRGVRAHG
jgi:hypothetical protein